MAIAFDSRRPCRVSLVYVCGEKHAIFVRTMLFAKKSDYSTKNNKLAICFVQFVNELNKLFMNEGKNGESGYIFLIKTDTTRC